MADMYKATVIPSALSPSGVTIDFPDEIVTHTECFMHNALLGFDDMNAPETRNHPWQLMINGTTTKNRIPLPFLLQVQPTSAAAYLVSHGVYYHYSHSPIRDYAESSTIPSGFPDIVTKTWGNTTLWFVRQSGCSDDPGIHLSQQYVQHSINLGGWG